MRLFTDSVKLVVDDQGLALSKMEYLPYGDTWFEEGDSNNAPKYNSQELDKETGYYFYNARHYDPEISRFVTADNVVDGELDSQGWNRFAYCHGNPIIYKDPTGHIIILKPTVVPRFAIEPYVRPVVNPAIQSAGRLSSPRLGPIVPPVGNNESLNPSSKPKNNSNKAKSDIRIKPNDVKKADVFVNIDTGTANAFISAESPIKNNLKVMSRIRRW